MKGTQRFRKPVTEAAGGIYFYPTQKANKKERMQKHSRPEVPEGMFCKCGGCGRMIYEKDLKDSYYCCPHCGKYFRISPAVRIKMVADAGSFFEWDRDIPQTNPLQFPEYEEKLQEQQEKTGLSDAVVTGEADIRGKHTALGVMSPDFMLGSMGTVVGERITRMVERATDRRLPVILFCCSGGARMQEGICSLMQMAKITQALKRHHKAGLPYITVLTDPTMGGVTASFAMLGDVILAEPGAMIGFAGARVIRQTIGQKLPEGFQSAEFLQKHGFVDRIVKREHMRKNLSFLLEAFLYSKSAGKKPHCPQGLCRMENKAFGTAEKSCGSGKKEREGQSYNDTKEIRQDAWRRVCEARSLKRPAALDYIHEIFDHFLELRGDRYFGDDRAVIGGVARLEGRYVMVIGQQKGRSLAENKHRNFGMPSPEGYRKSLRLIKLAEKFCLPVLLLVDTPGAFCGIEAEERGQGEAIARNLFELADLKVPVLSLILGEGGSGGALALAVANQVWMMENAVYSVLSPEGFAAILWKDGKRVQEAAQVMKITARDMLERKIIDRILPEEEPADREHMDGLAARVKEEILIFLQKYEKKTPQELTEERYRRFRELI